MNNAENIISIHNRIKDRVKHELGDLINADTILIAMYRKKIDELCKNNKSLCKQAEMNKRLRDEYGDNNNYIWVYISDDLVETFGINKNTIWSWCVTGKIISRKVGSNREILFEDLKRKVEKFKQSNYWLKKNKN